MTTTHTAAPAASSTEKAFFNFHATGVGWMNRVRLVTPKRGEPFLACAITALHGAVNDPERSYLDLRVSGDEAQKLVGRIQKHLEKDAKVFVSFKAGDLYPHMYERQNRETGRPETAALIKGRLLSLSSVKIDGEKVWPVEKPTGAPATQEETPAPAADPAPVSEEPAPAFAEEEAAEEAVL